jgi:hypothetical protein
MKNIKIILLTIFIGILISCQNEHLNELNLNRKATTRLENANQLSGTWTLVNISGGFAGTNTNFPAGWITWEFNEANQTVIVVNNNLFDAPLYDGPESGTYNYNNSIITSCGTETIPLNIINQFESCYEITNNTLVINNNQIADGFKFTLVRVENCNSNYIIFGHFYGECGGEACIEKFKITATKIFEDTNDVYPGTNVLTPPNYVQLSNEKFLATQDLMSFFPNGLLAETNTTIGMPDASDGGGLYIEYHFTGVHKIFLIDQFKQNVPSNYHAFMDKVNEKIALLQ